MLKNGILFTIFVGKHARMPTRQDYVCVVVCPNAKYAGTKQAEAGRFRRIFSFSTMNQRGFIYWSVLLWAMTAAFLTVVSCSGQPYGRETADMLRVLDDSIARRTQIGQRKEAELTRLKSLLSRSYSPVERYEAATDLFDAYLRYNLDSAFYYAFLKERIARTTDVEGFVTDVQIDLVRVNGMAGLYVEALSKFQEIDTARLTREEHMRYLEAGIELYESMSNVEPRATLYRSFRDSLVSFRRKIISMMPADALASLFQRVSLAHDLGRDEQTYVPEMEDWLADESLSLHERAILSYLLSRACRAADDKERALRYLAQSAICDISTPVREHKSLYELASMLYELGDIERANRYIEISVEDLEKTKARVQMQSLGEIIPVIHSAFQSKKEHDRKRLAAMLAVTAVVSVLLVVALVVVHREKRKVQASEKKTEQANQELNATNAKLNELNRQIVESDRIKEMYVGQYMKLCSTNLERFDAYRSRLLGVLRTQGPKAAADMLKPGEFMIQELSEFYQNFDESFLHIYPDFVKEFNALLREDCRFEIVPGKPLTTELRVFALIRLGITDSSKIAEFLRRSVSTIYNYRVKMRNAALVDRDNFEANVMKIGRNE